jgi:hypothetical protein
MGEKMRLLRYVQIIGLYVVFGLLLGAHTLGAAAHAEAPKPLRPDPEVLEGRFTKGSPIPIPPRWLEQLQYYKGKEGKEDCCWAARTKTVA